MAENIEEKTLSKGEQTRQAVVEAAYTLFLERGYHGTSMRQIAERANLALGGIYNHFASKEEIFAAVLDAYHPYHTVFPALEKAEGETIEDFVRDAAQLVKREIAGAEERIVPLAFIELVEFRGRHLAELAQKLLPVLITFVERFGERRGKLRADIPAPLMLRMLFATFVGYLITETVLKSMPVFKDMDLDWFDGMMDIYLHGILESEA